MQEVELSVHTPALDELEAKLGGLEKNALNQAVVEAVYNVAHEHLTNYALSHHKSANRLGAVPTGHIEEAARAMTYTVSGDGGQVDFSFAGASRAYHDLNITPKASKWLTIPTHREAYGVSVIELAARGWHTFKPKNHDVIMGYKAKRETPVCLYALKKVIRVPKDPSILPKEEAMSKGAEEAAIDFLGLYNQ